MRTPQVAPLAGMTPLGVKPKGKSTQHTPGPWQQDEQADGHFSIWASDQRDNGELIATVYDNSHTPTAIANTSLIVAAPNLLAALLRAEALIAADIVRDDAGVLYAVRAAIAKATGDA